MCEKNIKPADKNESTLEAAKLSTENMISRSQPLYNTVEGVLSAKAYKLFDIYLSCINPQKDDTCDVIIRKTDISDMLGLKRFKTSDLIITANELGDLKFCCRNVSKDYLRLNLFSFVHAFHNDNGEVFLHVKCSEEAKRLFFNLETVGYIKYQLKNTLALSTKYEIRMYLYLQKQKHLKKWNTKFNDLKKVLFLEEAENMSSYDSYKEFNRRVLSPSIKSINEKTDLKVEYSYKAVRGKGSASGVLTFTILSIGGMVLLENIKSNDSKYEESSERIKQQIGYDMIVDTNNVVYVDQIVRIMCDIDMAGDVKSAIKINSISVPISQLQAKFKSLTGEEVLFVCKKYRAESKKVKNVRSYITSCLYNAAENLKLDKLKPKGSFDIDDFDDFVSNFHALDDYE